MCTQEIHKIHYKNVQKCSPPLLIIFKLGYTQHKLYFIHLNTCTVYENGVLLSSSPAGEYKKEEMLEAARNGNEERLAALLTPLNVNCHAMDGRKSTPLHLAAGYNRTRIVQLLLKYGADVHAKDKGFVFDRGRNHYNYCILIFRKSLNHYNY